jgi:hypothetical protein
MAAFQLDHNVPAQLRIMLRAAGHDVVDAREQGLERAPDPDVLLDAAQAGRLLVTHNQRHFTVLHRAWCLWPIALDVSPVPTHAGIMLLPQPPRATPADLARAIEAALAGGATLTNQLWRWAPSRGWSVDTL